MNRDDNSGLNQLRSDTQVIPQPHNFHITMQKIVAGQIQIFYVRNVYTSTQLVFKKIDLYLHVLEQLFKWQFFQSSKENYVCVCVLFFFHLNVASLVTTKSLGK